MVFCVLLYVAMFVWALCPSNTEDGVLSTIMGGLKRGVRRAKVIRLVPSNYRSSVRKAPAPMRLHEAHTRHWFKTVACNSNLAVTEYTGGSGDGSWFWVASNGYGWGSLGIDKNSKIDDEERTGAGVVTQQKQQLIALYSNYCCCAVP